MNKNKITLTTQVELLLSKYLELNDVTLDDLANQALKTYLVEHLSSAQVKEALKAANEAEANFTSKLFQKSIDDLNTL